MSSKEWTTHKLGYLLGEKGYVRGPFGSSLKRGEMKSSGIPVYEQQHAIYNSRDFRFYIDEDKLKELKRFQVKTNDLIVSCSGTIGKVSIIREEDPKGIISQALLILRPDNTKVIPEYLQYYFSTREGFNNLVSTSHGSVQINIAGRNIVEGIQLKVPNIPTQRRIVGVLSALDEKIELNRQTNATLEAIAQSIFREWFVDGEDVENWKVGKLEEIVDINMGQSPSGESYNQNGEGIIFFQGKAEFGFRFPTVDKYTTEPKKFAKPFDTLLSVRAPVGSINMASEKCCIGRGLAAISGKNNVWSFTFYLLKSLEEHFNSYEGTGTVFGSINKKELENITVVIPPQEAISEFERIVNPIDMAIFNLEQQSATLASLRNTLLPKLMSGELEC